MVTVSGLWLGECMGPFRVAGMGGPWMIAEDGDS